MEDFWFSGEVEDTSAIIVTPSIVHPHATRGSCEHESFTPSVCVIYDYSSQNITRKVFCSKLQFYLHPIFPAFILKRIRLLHLACPVLPLPLRDTVLAGLDRSVRFKKCSAATGTRTGAHHFQLLCSALCYCCTEC